MLDQLASFSKSQIFLQKHLFAIIQLFDSFCQPFPDHNLLEFCLISRIGHYNFHYPSRHLFFHSKLKTSLLQILHTMNCFTPSIGLTALILLYSEVFLVLLIFPIFTFDVVQ